MSRMDKIKLFSQFILLDLDTKSNVEIIKCAYNSALHIKSKQIASVYSLLSTDPAFLDISHLNDYKLLSQYSDDNFYCKYHLKKETFCMLLDKIKNNDYLMNLYEDKNFSLPIEKSILITLYYLAKGVSLSNLCDTYKIRRSLISPLVESIIDIFVNMQNMFIMWPNQKDAQLNASIFFKKHKYPNVIGALGSIHINFKPPLKNEEIYRNKNMGYSLILQGICNSKKEFLNISTGFPGSMDAVSVLKNSMIYAEIKENSSVSLFYNKYHLVANEMYPLRNWIMVPFRDDQIYSTKQERHNKALISVLSNIEFAFSLLQGRWKIINFINSNCVINVQNIIESCCMLHNFCIKHDDCFDDMLINLEDESNVNYFDFTEEGEIKRNKNLNMFR